MKNPIRLLILSIVIITGCSSSNPIVAPQNEILSVTDITNVNILGAYELTIDANSMTADLIQSRQPDIGESWTISGRSYFDVRPCVDCFKVSSLKYADGNIIVKFDIQHPFDKGDPTLPPSGKNRLDLNIFDPILIVVPEPFVMMNYPLLETDIPAYFIGNPDGYTVEISDVIGSPDAFPYVLVVDDTRSVPPSNTWNRFEMESTTDFEVVFPLKSHDIPGQVLTFNLYLTFGYGFSAVLKNRLDPKYFNPEFNRKAAWKVEVIPPNGTDTPQQGNTWDNYNDSTEYDVTVKVYDWQIGSLVNPALENITDIYTASGVDKISIEIPGMTTGVKTVAGDSYAPGGTGMPASPLVYKIPIANENRLTSGEYIGLVAVFDQRAPLPTTDSRDFLVDTPDGGLNLNKHEIPAYVTYQTFIATVVNGLCGPITGEIIEPSCPVTGLYNESTVDFKVTASSEGYGYIVLYEADYNYDGVTFDTSDSNTDGFFNNTGPFIVPDQCYENVPRDFTVAFRATDSCVPPNVTIFATCTVTVEYCNTGGNLLWAKRIWGISSQISKAVTTLSDDTTIVTGSFGGTANLGTGEPNATQLYSSGASDIFLARYNPDGTLEWARRDGGTDGENPDSITTLSDNSVVISGEFRGMSTFGENQSNATTLTSYGQDDIFIARYHADGTFSWVVSAGGSLTEEAHSVTALSDNSIMVTGCFMGTVTFGRGEPNESILATSGYDDFFIARYNPNGTLNWVRQVHGNDHEIGYAVTSLSDNSSIVTGVYSVEITFGTGEPNETTLENLGETDIFIARYNPDGTLQWAKRAAGTGSEKAQAITALSDNSIALSGRFSYRTIFGQGEANETTLTNSDGGIFTARYNPDGTLQWAKGAWGSDWDETYAITTLSDNSTVITGYFDDTIIFGPGEPNETSLSVPGTLGQEDIFIARYYPDGTLAWAKRAGGSKYDHGNGISSLSDDSCVVAGKFEYKATFGPDEPNEIELTSFDLYDAFIARFAP